MEFRFHPNKPTQKIVFCIGLCLPELGFIRNILQDNLKDKSVHERDVMLTTLLVQETTTASKTLLYARHKGMWQSEITDSLILNFGTKWS
jgi:hypothetical protein